MVLFYVLLFFVLAGLIVIVVLFLQEQRSGKDMSLKIDLQDKDNQALKIENEHLNASIKKLSDSCEILKKDLEQKEAALKKVPSVITHNIADLIDHTKLKDIMSSEVISIQQDAPFADVARKMKEFHVRHLPVVDYNNKLVGLITQRMLYQIKSPRKLMDGDWYYDEEMLNDVILKHVMATDIFSLSPDQSMGKALMKMTYGKFGCVPIVDESNKLLGIVTRKDILKVAAHIYEKKYE